MGFRSTSTLLMPRAPLKVYLLEVAIRVVFPLLGVTMLVSGFSGVLSFGVMPLFDAMRSREWTPVSATLIDARVEPANVLRSRPLPAIKLEVSYTFQGEAYVGSRYGLHDGFAAGDVAEARVQALRARESLVAWVNPQNPRDALLDRSLDWQLFIMVVPFAAVGMVGGVLLLGGMVAWNEGWRRPRRDPGAPPHSRF